ncbi:neuropeptide Y receptor type 5-like [Scyliorhinus canicula]|uniref:neuropeptide Y receptor type 5-like n=1 Tax=Scyliorhinus canicula TaxID=7830 RepID=UPI0018F2FD11|nr:neuropeptide Y receptor type 5-like [Scyliorhinus canicula]
MELYNMSQAMKNETHLIIPDAAHYIIIIMYASATLLSLSGNILVIWVLTMGCRTRTDITVFLINLAVADLTMAIFCIPLTFTEVLLQRWLFGELLCPLVRFAQILSVSVSIYTLMTIGVDRYYAVCHPLKSRMGRSRSKILIAVIWMVSFSIASVQLFVSRAKYMNLDSEYEMICLETGWPNNTYRKVYTLFLLLFTYMLPLFILTITYWNVGLRLWGRRPPGNMDKNREAQQDKSKRKVIKMLFIIVAVFALCWLPFHIFSVTYEFNPAVLPSDPMDITALYFFSHYLAMSHSFWNPLIYGFYNDNFRADLQRLCIRFYPFRCCLHMYGDNLSTHSDSDNFRKENTISLRLSSVESCRSLVSRKQSIGTTPRSVQIHVLTEDLWLL